MKYYYLTLQMRISIYRSRNYFHRLYTRKEQSCRRIQQFS